MRILAVLAGIVGLWLLGGGVLSQFTAGPVPAIGAGAILGAILVSGAVFLWRRGASRSTAERS